MSVEVLNPGAIAAGEPASWTGNSAGLVADITDDSDATYGRSAAANVLCKLGTVDPGAVTGTLVAVCPWARAKKDGARLAQVIVLGYSGKKYKSYVSTGFALTIPTAGSATDYEVTAPNGLHNFTYLGPSGEESAEFAGLGLYDTDSSADRAIVYEAGLKAYYLEPATIDNPSAPTGTVDDSQMPDVEVDVSCIVESWQVPSGELTWLCGGTLEARIYRDADVPGGSTSPPPLADPVWSDFVRFTEATYGDGSTPSEQTVTATPDVPLSNGDYWVFTRASRDLPDGPELDWSAWSYGEFTIDVDPPNTPTLAGVKDDTNQCVDLTVTATTTTGYDDGSYEASIERSDDGGLTWTKVRACQDVAITIGANAVGSDYEAPRGTTVKYRARVSAELSAGGTQLWSAWDEADVATHACTSWNLKVPEQPTLNWPAASVRVDPQAQRDQQVAVFHPLDRDGAVALSSPVSGETGTLTIYYHDATEIATFKALVAWEGALYLETPWGEERYIRVTDVSWVLGGLAADPWRTASLEYVEIGAPSVS